MFVTIYDINHIIISISSLLLLMLNYIIFHILLFICLLSQFGVIELDSLIIKEVAFFIRFFLFIIVNLTIICCFLLVFINFLRIIFKIMTILFIIIFYEIEFNFIFTLKHLLLFFLLLLFIPYHSLQFR